MRTHPLLQRLFVHHLVRSRHCSPFPSHDVLHYALVVIFCSVVLSFVHAHLHLNTCIVSIDVASTVTFSVIIFNLRQRLLITLSLLSVVRLTLVCAYDVVVPFRHGTPVGRHSPSREN